VNKRPVLLVIRDGWGENHNHEHDSFNAVKLAVTPVADRIRAHYPRTEILTCGPDVGLPHGVMGNSEVGHQNIGAGRIVDQEIVRIDRAFANGEVRPSPVVGVSMARLKETGGRLHLMGLVSDAGVHSVLRHLYGLLEIARDFPVGEVFIHAFTDGRDTSPRSGLRFIREIEEKTREIGLGRIASVCGRYWSMDRDERWDRVARAYHCLVGEKAEAAASAEEAVIRYYGNPLDATRCGDEFIVPTWIVGEDGGPIGAVRDGDSLIFFNFRGDRPRELTRAFIDEDFDGFARGRKCDLFYATMTEYQAGLCANVIFRKPPKMEAILGKQVSELGIPQFRSAETEKYPHVTFFFNDYRDAPFPGEEHGLVPSPKDVVTYDQKPEMSAPGICDAAKAAIESGKYGLLVVNFANADMVGHTGNLEAAIKACEEVDRCLGVLLGAVDKAGGAALVTADHGNSDQMWDPEVDGPHTAHTLNPVEVVIVGEGFENLKLSPDGCLADIAPTVMRLMGIDQPAEMTGKCLIL
jgi:2,3-bisphosphoglycerate-independent phosphoglycerate mutase